MLLVSDQNRAKYAGTFLIAIGVFQASPMLIVSLPSLMLSEVTLTVQGRVGNNLTPYYVRAVGMGVIISLANCSAFIGTFIYLQRDA